MNDGGSVSFPRASLRSSDPYRKLVRSDREQSHSLGAGLESQGFLPQGDVEGSRAYSVRFLYRATRAGAGLRCPGLLLRGRALGKRLAPYPNRDLPNAATELPRDGREGFVLATSGHNPAQPLMQALLPEPTGLTECRLPGATDSEAATHHALQGGAYR